MAKRVHGEAGTPLEFLYHRYYLYRHSRYAVDSLCRGIQALGKVFSYKSCQVGQWVVVGEAKTANSNKGMIGLTRVSPSTRIFVSVVVLETNI